MCLVLVSAEVTLTIFYKEKIGVVLLCRDQGVVEDAAQGHGNTLEEGSGILVYPEPLSLFVLGPTWSDLINVEDSDWESDANDEANTFEEHENA